MASCLHTTRGSWRCDNHDNHSYLPLRANLPYLLILPYTPEWSKLSLVYTHITCHQASRFWAKIVDIYDKEGYSKKWQVVNAFCLNY